MFVAQFPVTRNDDNACFLVFSKPRTAFPPEGILVELFHRTYGVIQKIMHFFSNCELNQEMCSKIYWAHPALPATFEVQLWPRHIEITLGNVVWQASETTTSERRVDEGHVIEAPCISESTPSSLTQEDSDEDFDIP